MRILITNNTLDTRAGSELYARDLAIGLLRRGHSPIAYSERLGEVAQEIRAATVPVIDNLDALAAPPDVIHGQHHLQTMTALLRFPGVPAVFVCHGWLPWEERPPRFPRILRYVAVDEACRDRLILESGVPPDRVRLLLNFVDLDRFKSRGPLPARPQRAVIFSNYANDDTHAPAVGEACARHGIKVDLIGACAGNVCARPEDILGDYDLVFAKGRSALEALAVGAAVVLCDERGMGPLVTSAEIGRLRRFNFGLRALCNPVEADALDREIARYDAHDAAKVSRLIRATAGRDLVVDQLISLYGEALAENQNRAKLEADDEHQASAAYLRSLASTYKTLNANTQQLLLKNADTTRHLGEVTGKVAEKEQQLQEKENQLQRITNSFGWRLLSRYGPFKYRVVVPARRRLRKIFQSSADAPTYPNNASPAPIENDNNACSQVLVGQEINGGGLQEVFSHIYQRRAWGVNCESVSGPGSSVARTSAFSDDIANLFRELNARTVLDAGCGDFNWMSHLNLDLDQYIGIDVVSEIITENQQRYGDSTRTFLNLDFTRNQPDRVDLILCRDCLVHLSFEDIANALRKFRDSGSTFLLTTTFGSLDTNTDILAGDWRPLNLQLPPFSFPPPIKLIDEKRLESNGRPVTKCLALWALRDIPL